jgi:hypothetical protein
MVMVGVAVMVAVGVAVMVAVMVGVGVGVAAMVGVGVVVVMNYTEINAHTGERRQHTEASLRARLLAINVSSVPVTGLPKLPLDTMHSWFRQLHSRDLPACPARDTGAWGLDTVAQACSMCNGTGKLQYKTADASELGDCWRCNGKGTTLVPV